MPDIGSPAQVTRNVGIGNKMEIIGYIILGLFQFLCSIRILEKTGNPKAVTLAFLSLIPIVGAIIFMYIAFSAWPIEKELEQYKEQYGELPEATQESTT